MSKVSAGLLMFRWSQGVPQYFLVHPGGPYFRNKDLGSWTIPKGLINAQEDMLQAAIREFQEETGITASDPYYSLGHIKQKGGKRVHAWAFKLPEQYASWDPHQDLVSNTFQLEWPPRSGKYQAFPEIDRANWFDFELASKKINPAQIPLLETLRDLKLR